MLTSQECRISTRRTSVCTRSKLTRARTKWPSHSHPPISSTREESSSCTRISQCPLATEKGAATRGRWISRINIIKWFRSKSNNCRSSRWRPPACKWKIGFKESHPILFPRVDQPLKETNSSTMTWRKNSWTNTKKCKRKALREESPPSVPLTRCQWTLSAPARANLRSNNFRVSSAKKISNR